MRPGLVSISFRDLSIEDIVSAATNAQLEGIEWGGDVHVPHGDVRSARNAKRLCESSGVETPSYGSYFRLGKKTNPPFDGVLDCAEELDAHVVRIWAGSDLPSAEATSGVRLKLADECREICDMAEKRGIRVATEYHAKTLTDTNESALQFFEEVKHKNLRTYWQPPNGRDVEYCAEGLRQILDRVELLHVFHWGAKGGDDKRPLHEGVDRWRRYLRIANKNVQWAMMEFVQDNLIDNLYRDATVLKGWLSAIPL